MGFAPGGIPACQAHNVINCTVYHMATLLLRSRTLSLSISAFWPTWAATLQSAFHPSSAPLLLSTGAARVAHCRQDDATLPMRSVTMSGKDRDVARRKRKEELQHVQDVLLGRTTQTPPLTPSPSLETQVRFQEPAVALARSLQQG